MRLHAALKDDSMKYPRAANVTLDFGMLLNILGALTGAAASVGMLSSRMLWLGVAMLGSGFAFLMVSKYLAAIKVHLPGQTIASKTTYLKRIK